MELLVLVISQGDKLEEILTGLLALGVTGATVIESQGMGHVLRNDVPVFAGLQSLMKTSRPDNVTVFSVIAAPHPLEEAIAVIQKICGDLDQPGTGILFTVPVTRVLGLAAELPRDAD